jgi:P-type conjugative transfer protein TrbL
MVDILLQVVVSDPSNFTATYEALYPQWITAITPYANELFYALAFLDLAVFGWTLIRRHGNNIQGAILSTANRLVLIGAFLALLINGSAWMGSIINMFIQVGKAGSGVQSIQPSVVLKQGIEICFALFGQSVKSGVTMDPLTSAAFLIATVAIAASFLVIAVEFVLSKIQTFLALGMGFFFLAFGGSGWTRNYVERYFAYAFSSGIRLMANYFLIGAGLAVSQAWLASATSAPWSFDGVKIAWNVMFGAVLFAAVAWKGSAMAAQLLGGGPNLSHGDVFHALGTAAAVGTAAAMSAGIAGAVGAGGGATSAGTAGGAAKVASAASPGAGAGTPASKPSSGGGSSSGSRAASQASAAAANALRSLGSAGSHQVHVPTFKGFGNDD